jgi:hypothetical protein
MYNGEDVVRVPEGFVPKIKSVLAAGKAVF